MACHNLLYPALNNSDGVDVITHKSVFLIILITVISIFFAGCGKSGNSVDLDANLRPMFSFGHEGEVLLDHSMWMITDHENAIFVSQEQQNKIYQFDLEGTFQRQIGRAGQGPGEFGNLWELSMGRQWLYAGDGSNMRLVMFALDGDSSKVINVDRPFMEFGVNGDRIYTFAPRNLFERTSEFDEKLIRVYDQQGILVDSFGEYLTVAEEPMPAVMSWPHMAAGGDVVNLIFQYFPIYRAYSTEGELLVEQDLSELLATIPDHKQNYDESAYTSNALTPQGVRVVFMGTDIHENRVFTARYIRGGIVIDEYRFNGREGLTYTTTYAYHNLPKEYGIESFFYHPASNSFYIFEYNEVPKVTAYRLLDDEVEK